MGIILASHGMANAATEATKNVKDKDVETITVSGVRGSIVR